MGINLRTGMDELTKIDANLYTSVHNLFLCTMHCSRGLGYEDLKTSNSFLPLPHHTHSHTNLYTYPYIHPLSGWRKLQFTISFKHGIMKIQTRHYST